MTDEVWRALADPTRRRILDLLRTEPRTTGALVAAFPDLTRFAVMKHLTTLERANVVVVRRDGRHRWNHINAVPLRRAYERFLRPHADAGAETLLRLADAVTREDPMSTTAPTVAMTTMDNQLEVTLAASQERVFEALTAGIGAWWPHRVVQDSAVQFEARLGGRFYEDHGNGDGVVYATVTALQRPDRLVLNGPMGIRGPVAAIVEFTLSDDGDGTTVRLSHKAVGDISHDTMARYATGWSEVFDILREHLVG